MDWSMTWVEWAILARTVAFIGIAVLVWVYGLINIMKIDGLPVRIRQAFVAFGSFGPAFALAIAVGLLTQPPFSFFGPDIAAVINGVMLWAVFIFTLIVIFRQRRKGGDGS